MDVDGLDKLSIKFDHGYQLVDRAGKNVARMARAALPQAPAAWTLWA